MFKLKTFILNTLNSMLGEEPEYKVRKFASEWYDKDVLTLKDLENVDTYYKTKSK